MVMLLTAGLTLACGSSGGDGDKKDLKVDQTDVFKDNNPFPTDITEETKDTIVFPDLKEDNCCDSDGISPDIDIDSTGDLDGEIKPDIQVQCTKDSDCEEVMVGLGPCQKAVCNKHLGLCVPGSRPMGSLCDDDDLCTYGTTCNELGECVGSSVVCDDGNICTTDSCQPEVGCVVENNDNVCNDGNGCTQNDRCTEGACKGETSPECTCQDNSDCAFYDDNNLCNGVVQCIFEQCKIPSASIVTCDTDSDSQCIKTVCSPSTGQCEAVIRGNGRPCDDEDACTIGDLCLNGDCIGAAPRPCDDDNPCTLDTCDADTGCLHEFNQYPCDDGDTCTINDQCRYGQCYPGTANECDDSTCYPKWNLVCGAQDSWSTAGNGSTNNLDVYACPTGAMEGPEYTYSFVASYDGQATLTVTSETPELWAFVLESRNTGCDSLNCRAASNGIVTFDVFQGQTYYIVLDSPVEEGVFYTVELDCMPHLELNCANGLDDDGDELVDCDDLDCADTQECPAPFCLPIWNLQCNTTDFGANYGLGTTDAIDRYSDLSQGAGCLDNEWDYDGPEFAYRFDAPGNIDVTIELSNESAQTDLLILKETNQGCAPMDCIAWGQKKVTFPAEGGETYYFVVDGYHGAEGSFNIEVRCSQFVETNCADGVDNDLDSHVDCADDDCSQAFECIGHCEPVQSIGCGFKDAFANFGWGSTTAIDHYACTSYDYAGPEVAYRFSAPFDVEVTAGLELNAHSLDILLLEGDTCDPDNCIKYGLNDITFVAEANKTYDIVIDGFVGDPLGTFLLNVECNPTTEVDCADGLDNDGDGLTDCADEEDCSLSDKCPHCLAENTLSCGDQDQWNNNNPDTTDEIPQYGCAAATFDGPEFSYFFEPEATGNVTLTLNSTQWDLDLFVLQDNGYGCNPANCIAWGTNTVKFNAQKGLRYYFVVDGYGKAPTGFGPTFGTSDYTLTVDCD